MPPSEHPEEGSLRTTSETADHKGEWGCNLASASWPDSAVTAFHFFQVLVSPYLRGKLTMDVLCVLRSDPTRP